MNQHASCILYDGQKCNGKEGLKELSNGADVTNVKEMLHFNVESVSVRHGCQLTVYTGRLAKIQILATQAKQKSQN